MHVQAIAEELARRGHEVTVITSRYHPSLPRDEVVHNGVRVIRLWSPIHISRGMIMPAYPLAMFLAMRNADIVSIHTPMLETALVATLAKLTGVNVVATHHGDLVLPDKPFNRFIVGTMFAMYRVMANWAAQLIAYSQDYAENSYYLRPYLHKTTPIYPPIAIPEPNAEAAQALRATWQPNANAPIIGYSGRFVEEKRPDLALKALETILKVHPNAKLVFAGEYDIPYEDTWQRHQDLISKYQENVIFLGLIKDPQDLANFYGACDVVVLTSDTECFALVQVEAMLCGTPMVMTDIAGGRVPVTVTGMGKLATQGDAVSIGQAVLDILADRPKYTKTRQEIQAIFSFEETVNRYEALFLEHARGTKDGGEAS